MAKVVKKLNKKMKSWYQDKIKYSLPMLKADMIYFSDASKTLDAWTGGKNYKWFYEITIGKLKINLWWRN